jgi:hypothetical protein
MKRTLKFQALAGMMLLALGAASIARADHGNNNDNNNNNNNNATETRLRTRLAGGAINLKTPEGNADFRSDSNGRTRLQVEVENVNLPNGTVLDVSVLHNGAPANVGHITLSASGFGELELNSQDGNAVPAVVSGDVVIVSNAGTAILSGTF